MAGVAAAADQAAEALFEFDDCLGQRVLKERFAAASLDGFHPSLLQRMVGDGEWQLGDDDVLQSVAGNVDSLPEAVGSEQHRSRVVAEAVEQHRALQAGSLAEQRVVLSGEPRRQAIRAGLQQLVAGEEHEGSAGSRIDVLFDLLAEFGLERGGVLVGVGHAAVQDQFRLPPVVERAAEFLLQRLRQSDAGLGVVEVLAAGRKSRAGEDHGRDFRKQLVAEHWADVDRATDQLRAFEFAAGPFGPIDRAFDLLPNPALQTDAELRAACRGGGVFELVALFRKSGTVVVELLGELEQFRRDIVFDCRRRAEPAVAAAEFRLEKLQLREEFRRLVPRFVDGHLGLQQHSRREQPLHLAIVPELVELVVDLPAADREPQVIAGHRFDSVGFVEHSDVVIGQDAPSLATHGEVGEEQRVIHDQDVGVPDSAASLEIVALLERRTFFAQAVVAVADDFVPDGAERLERQVLQAAFGRLRCPLGKLAKLLGLLRIAEQDRSPFEGELHPPQADVVRAAFDQHG